MVLRILKIISDSFRVHEICFQPGLRPRPHFGSLQCSPGPIADVRGPTSKGGRGRGEIKKGRGWEGPPHSQIPGSAPEKYFTQCPA